MYLQKKKEIIRQKVNHLLIIKVLCFEFDTILTSFDKLAFRQQTKKSSDYQLMENVSSKKIVKK